MVTSLGKKMRTQKMIQWKQQKRMKKTYKKTQFLAWNASWNDYLAASRKNRSVDNVTVSSLQIVKLCKKHFRRKAKTLKPAQYVYRIFYGLAARIRTWSLFLILIASILTFDRGQSRILLWPKKRGGQSSFEKKWTGVEIKRGVTWVLKKSN